KVSDGRCGADSNEGLVSITVRSLNLPPANCLASVGPDACTFKAPNGTKPLVVALNGSAACVDLTGSATDPEGQTLGYSWSENGVAFAVGASVTHCFDLGCHHLTFTATDPAGDSCSTVLDFCVISAGEAVEQCVTLVEQTDLDRQNKRP